MFELYVEINESSTTDLKSLEIIFLYIVEAECV